MDTNGLLLAVHVTSANVSDNVGRIDVMDILSDKIGSFKHLWCDAGFKRAFVEHCRDHHIAVITVAHIRAKVS